MTLDAYVAEHIVARLSRKDARELLHAATGKDVKKLETELLELRAELAQWRREAELGPRGGGVSLIAFKPAERRLLGEIEQVEAKLIRPDRALILRDLIEADDVGAAWVGVPLDRKRAVLGELFTVTVHPAPKGRPKGWRAGGPYFDPAYIDIAPA